MNILRRDVNNITNVLIIYLSIIGLVNKSVSTESTFKRKYIINKSFDDSINE